MKKLQNRLINSYLKYADTRSCEMTFANTYLWSRHYGTGFAIVDDMLVFGEVDGVYSYTFPVGPGDLRTCLETLMAHCREKEAPFQLHNITKEHFALLDELYGADLSGFRETEAAGVMRTAASFLLRTADGETQVMVSHNSDGQYLFITDPELRQQFLQGPADAFDWAALDRLRGEVLRNTQDPLHSGRVELPDSGFSASVSKGNSARARSTLDDAAATAEGGGESPCDILFEVDDVLYGINSDTGEFYRQEAGETVWAQLDSGELMSVKVSLGVLSATS